MADTKKPRAGISQGFFSVPCRLTLGELRSLTGLLETVLLSLDDSAIDSEIAMSPESRTVLGIGLQKGSGDTEPKGTGLSRIATSDDVGLDVVLALGVGHLEGTSGIENEDLVREVFIDLLAVDDDVSLTRGNVDAGDGRLSSSDG